jgi:hypothetical protein
MADIRQNPATLDNFDSYADGTILNAGTGGWYTNGDLGGGGGIGNLEVNDGIAETDGSIPRGLAVWGALVLDGNDQEVWAYAIGGGVSGISWRLALAQPSAAGVNGYSFTISRGTGGTTWFLARYDNFTEATAIIASGAGGATATNPGLMLIRRVGNDIEAWYGNGDPESWSNIYTATDATYTTNLQPYLWLANNTGGSLHGWDYFGGGPAVARRAQIYRWINAEQGEPVTT